MSEVKEEQESELEIKVETPDHTDELVLYSLQLNADYYCLNIYGYFLDSDDEDLAVEDNNEETKWSKEVRSRLRHNRNKVNFGKLLFIFLLQMSMILCMLFSMNIQAFLNGEEIPVKADKYPYVNLICKFLSSILLHAQFQPSIDQAIQWMKYTKYHPDKFENVNIVLLISMMKLLVVFFSEIVNMMFCAQTASPILVVICYNAFTVISNMDQMYYTGVKSTLKEQFESRSFLLPIQKRAKPLQMKLLPIVVFIYEVFYFHLFPMFIYLFVYWFYQTGNRKVRYKEWGEE